MQLKYIELQGFKSFAERAKIEFRPGITAIVGPNGSGKSNISDAIRWVLGEQSVKSLRGSKMEDIIFAGSSHKKAVGMAEVSITLDNSNNLFNLPYTEITVTRRIYRSGETEYLINKNICRLKDVYNLFADTGLGKESLTIIGQGKVGEILNSRPEDRRLIIEETAGTIKYRQRKREATKKLEDTENNLVRVRDIVTEIKSNLNKVEEEAAKARKYLQLKEQHDSLDINLTFHEINSLNKILSDLNEEFSQENVKYSILKENVEKNEVEYKVHQEKFDELENELNIVQATLYNCNDELNKLENDLNLFNERIENNKLETERLNQEITKEETSLRKLQEKNSLKIREHEDLKSEIAINSLNLKENEEQISCVERDLVNLRTTLNETEASFKVTREKLGDNLLKKNKIEYEISSLNKSIENNKLVKEDLHTDLKELEIKVDEHKKVISKYDQNIEELNDSRKNTKQEKEKLAAEIQKLNLILEKNTNLRNESLSQVKALTNLQNEYEGYYYGVKSVLKEAKRENGLKGICGVVGELITVSKEYERAIDVALGGSIQNIVALSEEDIKRAVNYLKEKNLGRATFLPLNSIQPREINYALKAALNKTDAKIIDLASRVVKTDTKYQKIIDFLLGNILLVQDLDTAIKTAKESKFAFRIITLAGDVINSGGSITGGSFNSKNTELLNRPRKINELKDKIKNLEEILEKERLEKSQLLGEHTKQDDFIEDITEKINSLLSILGENKNLLSLKEAELKRTKNDLKLKLSELEELGSKNKACLAELQELDLESAKLNNSLTNLESKIEVLEHEIKSLEFKNGEIIQLINEDRIKLAGLKEKEELYKNELEEYYLKTAEVQDILDEKKKQLVEVEERNIDLLNAIETKREAEHKLQEVKKEQSLLFQKHTVEKSKIRQISNTIEQQLKEEQSFILKNLDKLNDLKVNISKYENKIQNNYNKLKEKYDLDEVSANIEEVELEDISLAEKKIRSLSNELKLLGDVNISSIKEFEEAQVRCEFLTKQENDLSEAKESLEKLIEELDTIISKQFFKTFKEVESAFCLIFSKLFGGGSANLELTDINDILNSGVEIFVQPPGKKQQNLSLLSGGERSLTAIALLFALLEVKPSPFCVLDEIEAALDEANVDRFADFLSQYKSKTQFIIISHRQGTMEVADQLYGVTMEGSGISKLVSVSIKDLHLTNLA